MKNLLVVFSHGKESGPLGSKIRALMCVAEQQGADTLSVDYSKHADGTAIDHDTPGEADRRVTQLLSTVMPPHRQLVLVGSSMGGYVSTMASSVLKPAGLFLLAPAFTCPAMPARIRFRTPPRRWSFTAGGTRLSRQTTASALRVSTAVCCTSSKATTVSMLRCLQSNRCSVCFSNAFR